MTPVDSGCSRRSAATDGSAPRRRGGRPADRDATSTTSRRVAASSRVDWYGPGQTAVLARLRADRAELQSALTVAAAMDTDTALALFSDLCYHWAVGGFIPEGRGWATRVLALPGGSATHRVPALINAAWLCLLQGDLDEAATRLDEADSQTPGASLSADRGGHDPRRDPPLARHACDVLAAGRGMPSASSKRRSAPLRYAAIPRRPSSRSSS